MTEQEELLMLRQLVQQQKEELEKKDEIIRKQQIQIESMMQALLHARKKIFGPSSEAKQKEVDQMEIFPETEELAKRLFKEQEKITVRAHKRTPRKPGVREEMLAKLPRIVDEYIISPEETCSVCGAPLKIIGKEPVRTEVFFIPAQLKVVQVVRQIAQCTECGKKGSPHPQKHFQKAAIPSKVLPHSIATHSLAAHIFYQKFAMGVPLHRLEKDFYRMGLVLSRATMSHWVIRMSEEWFAPIYERIHQKLLRSGVLHMDETRIQCNKEPGKKASSESFMWVIQSAKCEPIKATFFYYSRSRSGEVAKKLLTGFNGYLITDAYSGYEKVEKIKRCLCFSHLRRYFIESIPLDSKGKKLTGSKGAQGQSYIDLLFEFEKKIKDLPFEEKKAQRQVGAKSILDAFWSWVEETSKLTTTNEKLTKALNYATNHKEDFMTFLEDGRIEISNNLCESHIRPFAVARKSWLFADTPNGATANAVLYTLVESAKQNDLNVYQYLDYLLTKMPEMDYAYRNHPELLDAYLPWSEELPEECRLIQKNKKCFK